MIKVELEKMAQEIASALDDYDQRVVEKTKAVIDTLAKEAAADLRKESPKRTGAYRKGWAYQTAYESARERRNTVYNKTRYQLTHLLEFGHVTRNGTTRTKEIPHIAPENKKIQTKLEAQLKAAL